MMEHDLPTKRELHTAQLARQTLLRQMVLLFSSTILLMLLMWAWAEVNDAKNFPVTDIVIQGNLTYMNADELTLRVANQTQEGFFALSVRQIREELLSFPWIADAKVRRVWPNRLDVMLKEHQPVSYWGDKSLLNAHGDIITPEKGSLPQGLVFLFGTQGREKEVLARYLEAKKQLEGSALVIQRFGLDNRLAWQVMFTNDLQVKLGQKDTRQRWNDFVATYPILDELNEQRLQVVDMRFTHGMAVQLKQPISLLDTEGAG